MCGMAGEPTGADTEQQLTYEQARDELVAIVAKLEAGGTTLEESLELWQRGEDLAALCQRYLDNARARLDAATESPDADSSGEEDDGGSSSR